MRNRYCINEEQAKELQEARAVNTDKKADRRLRALLLHAQGMKHEEIALLCEFEKSYVSKLVAKYRKGALEAVATNHCRSNNQNMTFEEEEAFLEPFIKAAQSGKIVGAREIQRAYEQKIGRELKSKGHIYRLLDRHGWRKVMPRPKHPKQASEEEQTLAKNKILGGGGVQ